MPEYTDSRGVTKTRNDYPGNSHRAFVINRALRRSEFFWCEMPPGSNLWNSIYKCCQCENYVPDGGVSGDHNHAQGQGGNDEPWNLQILCTPCNEADLHHRGGIKTRAQYRRSGKWKPVNDNA